MFSIIPATRLSQVITVFSVDQFGYVLGVSNSKPTFRSSNKFCNAVWIVSDFQTNVHCTAQLLYSSRIAEMLHISGDFTMIHREPPQLPFKTPFCSSPLAVPRFLELHVRFGVFFFRKMFTFCLTKHFGRSWNDFSALMELMRIQTG